MATTPQYPRRGWHIRTKLAVATSLLIAFIALFTYLFFPEQQGRQALESVAAKAESIGAMTAYRAAAALHAGDYEALGEAFNGALQNVDVSYLVVLDNGGRVVASHNEADAAQAHFLDGPPGTVSPDKSVYRTSAPLMTHGERLGQLYLGLSLEALHRHSRQSRLVAGLTSLGLLLIGMALVFVISAFVTEPLGRITKAADRIAQGDLSFRAAVHTGDEIGALAESFNHMVERLERAYRELEMTNRSLEAQQDELRQSEERYRDLFENAHDLIFSADTEGRLLYANDAWLCALGYRDADLPHLYLQDILHPSLHPYFREVMDYLNRGESVGRVELRFVTRRGEAILVEGHMSSKREEGRFTATRGIFRDVTEQRNYEAALIAAKEEAEEMARLKDSFLANMSHEIRTPLTSIIGFAQVLGEEASGDHAELALLIERSGIRLLETLNSVLDLARLESKRVQLALTPVDVVKEVAQAALLMRPLAEQKGLAFSVQVPSHAAFALSERASLGRVVANLVGNAVKFTEAGHVAVCVTADEEAITVDVEDTGIGISETFLPRLYDEFYQESEGLSRSHEGSGLGLAITKRLVQLMGGTLHVSSEKGAGSTFSVRLPRLQRSAPDAGVRDAGAPASLAQHG